MRNTGKQLSIKGHTCNTELHLNSKCLRPGASIPSARKYTHKMDNFPFAVLFLACLLSFPEKLFGKPANDLDSKELVWPDACMGQKFCWKKPDDYPSEEYLKQLYEKNKSKFPNISETTNRDGGYRNPCSDYDYYIENVYMLRMDNGEIRYAMYIRDMYDIKLQTKPCKTDATDILQWTPTAMKEDKCVNKTSVIDYAVLSKDMQNIEFVKFTYPSSCILLRYDKYE